MLKPPPPPPPVQDIPLLATRNQEPGVVPPADGLGTIAVKGGQNWVLSAHGGAGATTVAHWLGWNDAHGAWPVPTGGAPSRVIVCAHITRQGLAAAKKTALQWASGQLNGIDLIGVIFINPLPGKIPKPLREEMKLVKGAYANAWTIGYIKEARTALSAHQIPITRPIKKMISDLKG